MKTKILSVLLLFAAIITSCKSESNKDEVKTEEAKENFKVTLNVTVKHDDDFSLFYTEDNSTDFSVIQPIWVKVKGSNDPQEVVFTLPEDASPTQFRLDFGINQDQETILINGVKMENLGKRFDISGDQFYIYFTPDESKTIFNKDAKTIDAVMVDGKRSFPSFYPNTQPLGEAIQKLF